MEETSTMKVIDNYDMQLELMNMGLKNLEDALLALKTAKRRFETGRQSFPGRTKNFNKILKALEGGEAKIWDAKIAAQEEKNDIEACKSELEAEPNLPGLDNIESVTMFGKEVYRKGGSK